MTQSDFGIFDIDGTDGDELATFLEGFRDALHAMHKGNARPPYAVAGLMWLDDSDLEWQIKLFDGAQDRTLAYLSPATGVLRLPETADISVSRVIAGLVSLQSDAVLFKGGDHRITTNDGGGNFNIRLGHEYVSGQGDVATADGSGAVHIIGNVDNQDASVELRLAPAVVSQGDIIAAFPSVLRIQADGQIFWNGNKVWHAGNDGPGSNLNADLLDDEPSEFYRNAENINAGKLAVGRLSIATEAQAQQGVASDVLMTPERTAQSVAALASAVPDFMATSQTASPAASDGPSIGNLQPFRLDTVERNQLTGASLTSDEVTLPAGSYYIETAAFGRHEDGSNQNVGGGLYDVTNDDLLTFTFARSGFGASGTFFGSVIVTITVPTVYAIRCYRSHSTTRQHRAEFKAWRIAA